MDKEDSIEKYINWVMNKIDLLEEYSKSIQKPDVNIHDLKEILGQKLKVSLMLNSEYQRFKVQHRYLNRDFKVFWDEKYTLIRRQLNPTTLAGSKWASKSDIESETRFTYKDEYLKFKDELEALEDQMSFLRRLMDQWNTVSFDVSNYTKLIETEVYGLNNMNGIEETVRRRTRVR